jgi:FecR-like protein
VRVGQLLDAHGTGSARLSFSGGTELRLAQESRIAVKAMGAVQRFRLGHGRLHAEVAPLEPGQRFLIETPDGEIEVHGTVFELGVVPSRSPCPVVTTTRLIVLRGVVEVRAAGRDDFIRAGQHWPPECEALAGLSGSPGPTAAASPFAESPPRADRSATVAAPRPTHRDSAPDGRAPAISASELTAQNDLFAAAMTAKRRGQTTQALDELSRLIQRFPRGPLVEAAHVERMRLYRQSGDGASARRYAHEYLREFSNGFARAEAHLILGSTR